MAKQIINIGTENAGNGDSYRNAFDKAKQNFDDLYEASNVTGTATFTKPATWVASPTVPVTTTIQLSTAGAVSGAVAAVYFKGTSLAFSGGTVVVQSGSIVANELCLVWIVYDKASNSFHVNVQSGATGSVPTPTVDVPDAPTALILTEGNTAVSVPDAPTALILTEGTV